MVLVAVASIIALLMVLKIFGSVDMPITKASFSALALASNFAIILGSTFSGAYEKISTAFGAWMIWSVKFCPEASSILNLLISDLYQIGRAHV